MFISSPSKSALYGDVTDRLRRKVEYGRILTLCPCHAQAKTHQKLHPTLHQQDLSMFHVAIGNEIVCHKNQQHALGDIVAFWEGIRTNRRH
jgi:hypothetical protein